MAQGTPEGGQGDAQERPSDSKGGQARPGAKKDARYTFLGAQKISLFGIPRLQKSSQSRESDFLKTELSFENGAHFQREGLAKPGQRGLAKPGRARAGQSRQRGEVKGANVLWVLEA